jgi:sugar phosphate isomerase/epimerase
MKIGASLNINFREITTIAQFIDFAIQQELDSVELLMEPPFSFPGDIFKKQRKMIREKAESNNLDITIHGAFVDVNPASLNENVRNFFVSQIKESIEFAVDLGSTLITLHPGSIGAFSDTFLASTLQAQIKSFQEVTKIAEEKNVTLCLENMPIMPMRQIKETYTPKGIVKIVETIDSDNFGITWDIGHSNTTKIPMEEFAREYRLYLKHVHIHDNNGPGEGWLDTHKPLGKGTCDWEEVFTILNDLSYDGILNIELNSRDEIIHSLNFIKQFELG